MRGRYPQEVETAVYFCTLEALQNAAKYAKPGEVVVRLLEESGELVFTIEDDGEGFDQATTKLGSGLQNMADRLAALGGDLLIQSSRKRGTLVGGTGGCSIGSALGGHDELNPPDCGPTQKFSSRLRWAI